MMRRFLLTLAIVALPALAATQPNLSNGRLQPSAVTGRLTRAVIETTAGTTGTAWVGYAAPVIDGDRQMCCWSGQTNSACCEGCRLEPGSSSSTGVSRGANTGPVPLEGPTTFFVLYRVDAGKVTRIRMFSPDCPLDAGGLTVHWLTGVTPGDSISLLAGLLTASSPNRLADGALSALAMHRDPTALDRLISTARDGATTHLRGQALFWLAQRAGERAVGVISEAALRDPETDVKRRAVFALSQLPRDEGVPLLIQVARTNTNPAVRKQAMFWLGQSRDPRALKFFEEILFK